MSWNLHQHLGLYISLYEGTCLKADRAREEQLHYQAGAYEER